MAEKLDIYKCDICGNMTEAIHGGDGVMVCCGQTMTHMLANTVDAAVEKHVPVIEKTTSGYRVKIGEMAHPMEEKHFIEWIELIAGDKAYRHFLAAGNAPEAEFCVDEASVIARAYCNLHGLWKSE